MRGLLMLATVAATTAANAAPRVEIRYTSYGVAHIKANDFESLGYGYGWVFARDNLCLAVDHAITLAGERSQRLGSAATYFDGFANFEGGAIVPNLDSDVFYRAHLGPATVAGATRAASPAVRALFRGYARGFAAHANGAPLPGEDCRGKPGYRAISEADVWRRAVHIAFLETTNLVLLEIARAAPPGTDSSTLVMAPRGPADEVRAGSNAAAFGRALTGGGGVSFSNPHFPWAGIERLHAVQLSIPGKLDVMGAALYNFPLPMLGFNRRFGWSITYTTDQHATAYRLDLDPKDPTRYRYGTGFEAMHRVVVTVPTTAGPVHRTLWKTRYGFIAATAELPWTHDHATAFADPETVNYRLADQFLALARADSVADAKVALDQYLALPWSNLTAADANGKVLYANISLTPDIDNATLARCQIASPKPFAITPLASVLNGSDPACSWHRDPAAVQTGTVPPNRRPSVIRDDFVLNSNDSHWLPSWDAQRLEGFAHTIGDEATARGERTRTGILLARGRRDGTDGLGAPGVNPGKWEALFFRSANLTADLILDDVLKDCQAHSEVAMGATTVNLTEACAVLDRWDRTNRLDARGVILFREFLTNLERVPSTGFVLAKRFWRVPFDPSDPVGTPRGLRVTNETRVALAKAVTRMAKANLPLDGTLRSQQVADRGGSQLPLSGSRYSYNLIGGLFANDGRLGPVIGGDSYMHIVALTPEGPKGRFIITYSQSTNPSSPHFDDMTALFSTQSLADVQFSDADIAAAQLGKTIALDPSR